ncbi:MAG: transporter [Nitrospirae bacterium]|nr:transporter [Nitrospirota bacterium]
MFKKTILTVVVFLWSAAAFAAHPLITDDTGTQGKGKAQVEINGEYRHEDEDGITENITELAAILSYGIRNDMDIVVGIPYQHIRTKDAVTKNDEYGISDVSIEMKWRFYEHDNLSLALKPGITLPTGDEDKGLGSGMASYGMMFITTKEINAWAFHLNLGYTHNVYKLEADKDANRKDIWHLSFAGEVEVVKDLKAVANIGMERNPDKTSNTHPAFMLGGLIYSVAENFDIDIGLKGGLNKPETDYSILAGTALRF